MPNAFISGATTGMGSLLATKLADAGYRVFAGVLPGVPCELAPHERITVIEQDVAELDSVRGSADAVRDALNGEPLQVLMNVAGVANVCQGTIEGLRLEELERIFAVNTWGAVAVCQTLLPMIRQAGRAGRIFNFGSAAVLANPPVMGAYGMTKHAMHGLTRVLRLELAPWGTQVTSIWPGVVNTAMVANPRALTAENWSRQSEAAQEAYAPHLQQGYCEKLPAVFETTASAPEVIVDRVIRLIDRKRLRSRYLIGKKDAQWLGPLHDWLPESWFEAMIRYTYRIPSAS